jgi:subtilase family serine protease
MQSAALAGLLATASLAWLPGAAAVDPLPDLVVEEITWTPAGPLEGQAVRFVARVANVGNATAGNFSVRFWVDGAELSTHGHNASLPAGARLNVTSGNWTATFGNHTARAEADALGEVAERSEANNAREANVPVAGLPDLWVVDFGPGAIVPEGVRINATVRNGGNATAGSFSVAFHMDGVLLSIAQLNGTLAPGAEVNVTSEPWRPAMGQHTTVVTADWFGEVAESDETNNAREETWS